MSSLTQRIEKLAALAEQQALKQVGGALIAYAPTDAVDEELARLWAAEAAKLGWDLDTAVARGTLLVHRVRYGTDPVKPLRDRQQEIEDELAKLKAEQAALHESDLGVQLKRKGKGRRS